MARSPSTPDCSIKGCKRAVYKGFLCRAHYKLVPRDLSGYAAAMAAIVEAHKAGQRFHRRQLAAVRKVLAGA